jgi:hypothetical protein
MRSPTPSKARRAFGRGCPHVRFEGVGASRWATDVMEVVSEGGLEPHLYGNSPLNQSGSTDTSVALADILKRECAGGLVARLLGAALNPRSSRPSASSKIRVSHTGPDCRPWLKGAAQVAQSAGPDPQDSSGRPSFRRDLRRPHTALPRTRRRAAGARCSPSE